MHQFDLVHFGICDCVDEWAKKAELVDELLHIWDTEGLEMAAGMAAALRRQCPWFVWS
jgi:hypothetical protein